MAGPTPIRTTRRGTHKPRYTATHNCPSCHGVCRPSRRHAGAWTCINCGYGSPNRNQLTLSSVTMKGALQ